MKDTRRLWLLASAAYALLTISICAAEPMVVPLWQNGAPGSEAHRNEVERPEPGHAQEGWITNVHNPSLTVYLPTADNATGTAVVVAPGGGHRFLAAGHEGHDVAWWLAQHGIAGCVLKYRLYRAENSPYNRDDMLADGERAMRLVRSRAKEWNIDPERIGLLGFSAGGDLTIAVTNASDSGDPSATDPIDQASSRPDFQVPIYPGGLAARDTESLSETPPTLLICAVNDRDDIAVGITDYYLALREAGVPVELHIYGNGGHGFGIRPGEAAVNQWPDRFIDWLHDIGKLSQGS
jgi:acetyl esterase/lipase